MEESNPPEQSPEPVVVAAEPAPEPEAEQPSLPPCKTLDELLARYSIPNPPVMSDCLPGWLPLVEELVQDLIKMGWDRDLHQIKEKFGTLRFYIGQDTPEMRERIMEAEKRTSSICDTCGCFAQLIKRPNWIVRCDDCYRKHG